MYAVLGYGTGSLSFGNIPLPLNTTENVTLTYNATGNVATLCVGSGSSPACVNGTLSGAYVASGNPLVFGGGSVYYPANATFDEAAFWQGTVLTTAQIDTIASNVGAGASPSPTPSPAPSGSAGPGMCSIYGGSGPLSFCYDFDEASGTTLVDGSGAGHNGTISATGVTYHASGLTSNSAYAETTDGASGSMTGGFVPTTGSFSLSFFVNLHSNANNWARLVATGNPAHSSPASGLNIGINSTSTNNLVYAVLGYGSGSLNFGNIPLPLNTTENVTLTYNATGNVAMLCLGNSASPTCVSGTLSSAYVASGNALVFGGGSTYYPANATFDEAGYWQGTVLTTTQIDTIAAYTGTGVAPSPTPTPSPGPSATFNDYTTFGYDNQHDVFNPNSTGFTSATLSSLHLAWQSALDGSGGDYNTQTQPVLATEIPGHAGVLIVGGGTGNVYGFDALTGSHLWTRATGQMTYQCQSGSTSYFGVGGTVAYDPGSKSLYVAGNQNSSINKPGTNSLFHLDAGSGAVLGQVSFASPNSTWPSLDFSHTSVTLSNGVAYVGTSATCDISSWRGRVAAVNVPAMTLANTFYTVWNGTTQPWGGGGVWGWGGVSLDFSGNVLTGIGNTDNGTTSHGAIVSPFKAAPEEYSAYGDALVQLSSNLSTVEASNHPIPTSNFSGTSVDLDLNGTPDIFRPNGVGCDPLAAIQGKSGAMYLYDTTSIGNGPIAQYQLAPSSYADGFLGGPAYSPITGLLYVAVPSSNDSLYPPGMIAINPGCGSPSVAWHAAFGPDSYAPGSQLSPGLARSVPAASAGGVVFVGTICTSTGSGCSATTSGTSARERNGANRPLICCAPPGNSGGALWAVDGSTGTVLNGGNPLIITNGPIRMPPTIDGKWIFILDNKGNMYGLTIDPSYPAINAKYRAADPRQRARWSFVGPG